MQQQAIRNIRITKITSAGITESADRLAVEEPLEIQLKYYDKKELIKKSISVTMRTPGSDSELAAGFLFTEGIISERSQVAEIGHDIFDQNKVIVSLWEDASPQLPTTERNFYTTSSCGVCGKSSIEAIKTVSVFDSQKSDSISLLPELFFGFKDSLKKQQNIFQQTGGLHASAIFDFEGNFLQLREDVGRHNALDKIIGHGFLTGLLPLENVVLLLSGRASFELIQKSAMAGIKVVAAIGAPSSLAMELAESTNITLLGFLGDEKFNIYTHAQRISMQAVTI